MFQRNILIATNSLVNLCLALITVPNVPSPNLSFSLSENSYFSNIFVFPSPTKIALSIETGIIEPGLIKGRANARCGEKFMGCFCPCCYANVHVKSLAKAIMLFDLKLYDSDDVEKKNINDGYKRIVSNEEILNIVMEK